MISNSGLICGGSYALSIQRSRLCSQGEGKVAQIPAVYFDAVGGVVALAGTVSAELQRDLWARVLCRCFLSQKDQMVDAPRDTRRQRYRPEPVLLFCATYQFFQGNAAR